MVNNDLRDYLAEINPEMVLLDNPAYDECIIAVSSDDRAIYSYEKMLEAIPEAWGLEEEEDNPVDMQAADILSYDIMRAIDYMGEYKPIIAYDLEGYY